MIRLALFCAMVGMSLSQCPNTSPSTTSSPKNSCGSSVNDSNDDNTCQSVNTIIRPPSQLSAEQPLYIVLLLNTPAFNTLDNVCFTLFPLPDSGELFRVYSSMVYTNGSNMVMTYILKSFAAGANVWATPQLGYVNFNLGYIGCGAYLRYSCPAYGSAVENSFLAFGPGQGSVGNGTGKLTAECVRSAQSLANDNGLDLGDHYLLPYQLPTRCVFQQICQPQSSPLSSQQANSCKAYNSSSGNSD